MTESFVRKVVLLLYMESQSQHLKVREAGNQLINNIAICIEESIPV